jgi:hypothetical protein
MIHTVVLLLVLQPGGDFGNLLNMNLGKNIIKDNINGD